MRRSAIVLLALLALLVGAGCGGSDDERMPTNGGSFASIPELYRELEPSIVAVLVRTPDGGGEGSGVVVRGDKIVTNAHVVSGGREVTIALASGERLPATVVAADERTDIAVLDVERDDLPPARFADELPQIGSLAIAIGNPLGFEGSVTAGIVSGLDRAVPSGGQTPALVGLIQTDAAISPGNSGGALVGDDGRVIGINVAYIPPQASAVSIGFAIPATTAAEVVEELLANGHATHAFLGVQMRPLTPPIAQQLGLRVEAGALVIEVGADTPAANAGMRPGDVIVRVGDRRVEAVEDVFAALRERSPGDTIELEVARGEQLVELRARLAELPTG